MQVVTFIIAAMLLSANAVFAEMSFKASVDKLSAAFEDKLHLQLEVKVSDPAVKTTPLPPPNIIGLQIGGSGSSVERQGDIIVRNYLYELVPGRSGSITIPSFKVEFQNGSVFDTLASEPITVEIAQPKQAGKSHSPVIIIFSAAIIIIIAAAAARRRKVRTQPEQSVSDWRDEYRQRFAEVKKLADRQDYRAFASEAMRLITSLVERKYDARLSGFTSADLLRWLTEKGLDEEGLSACKGLFDFCESVKFSSGTVNVQDGSQAAGRAERIVELFLK